MNNNIKNYINQINQCKNDMLAFYRDLIVAYKNSIEIQEKIIDEYELQRYSSTILKCSQVVGYPNINMVVYWQILLLDGTKIYESDNYTEFNAWVLNLSVLDLSPGTQLKLKAIEVAGEKLVSSETLEYQPSTNTVYFKLSANSTLDYNGMIPSSLSPPVLKCKSLLVKNNAAVTTQFELRMADGSGTIYTSDKYRHTNTWTKNLGDLNIQPGTLLNLHAGVVAGNDSEPYAIIEYDPTASASTDTGNFELVGNAFLTAIDFNYIN